MYLHDMTRENALTVEDQDKVIGRTSFDIEMPRRQAGQLALALNTIEAPTARTADPAGTCRSGELGAWQFGTY